MENNRRYREGFSLIEVIIAVAILAILSVPILLYFTNSAIHTAHGKHEQAADLAAQSVIEEIDSISNFNNIEEKLVALHPDEWKIIPENNDHIATNSVADEDDDAGKTVMTREGISVDGTEYVAHVTIDYSAYGKVEGVTDPESKFNSYLEPQFQDVYSEGSVVITEDSNVFDIGIKNLHNELNGVKLSDPTSDPNVSLEDIKAAVKRKLKIVISEESASSTEFLVTGSCVFQYGDTEPVEEEVPLGSNKIEKNKLRNIYFLFMPFYGDSENFGGTIHQDVEIVSQALTEDDRVNYAGNVSFHFIRQNTYTTDGLGNEIKDASPEFFLTVMNTNSIGTKYYSNPGVVLDKNPVPIMMATAEPGQSKRIARIDVKVYDAATGIVEGKELAQNTTSKSK